MASTLEKRRRKLEKYTAYANARDLVATVSTIAYLLCGLCALSGVFVLVSDTDMLILGAVLLVSGVAMLLAMKLAIALTTVQFDIADAHLVKLDELDDDK